MMFVYGLVGVLLAVGLYAISVYNGLNRLRHLVEEGWSGIDVQLKRRADLIPNLVETVKGYASHEKETLEKVVSLRNSAMNASSDTERIAAENQITSALKTIFALAEAYPDLKANENFAMLQKDLGGIEDALQNARRYYNATARDFNIKVQSFPANILAGMFGFSVKSYFEADEEDRENVKVSF